MSTNRVKDLDQARLRKLEEKIDEGKEYIFAVSFAFREIRESQLWRQSDEKYFGFDDYCQRRWRISKSYVTRLTQAGEVIREMQRVDTELRTRLPNGNQDGKRLPIVPPAKESQTRELNRVSNPETRLKVWQHALDEYGEDATAKQVRATAAAMVPSLAPAAEKAGRSEEIARFRATVTRAIEACSVLSPETRTRLLAAIEAELEWEG